MEALIKNEVWGDRIGAIALDVFDGLRRSDTAGETVAEVVYETACGMLTGNTDSYTFKSALRLHLGQVIVSLRPSSLTSFGMTLQRRHISVFSVFILMILNEGTSKP